MMGDVTCVKFLEHRDPKIVFLEIGLLFDIHENVLNTVANMMVISNLISSLTQAHVFELDPQLVAIVLL